MKRKMRSWLGVLLCIVMLLQTMTVSAAEDVTEPEQPEETIVEYSLAVKETEHGTIEVKEKEKQPDETYKYQAEEKVEVQITAEEGYELSEVKMKGLDTNTELKSKSEVKENLYTWKATENMELTATFQEVEAESEPEQKPEEPDNNTEEQPETTPEEQPETEPEGQPETEPEEETETKPETEQEVPEDEMKEESPEQEAVEELLSLQPKELNNFRMAAPKGPTITRLGSVTYAGTTVGHFMVNGQIAFCMEHKKTTPMTGTEFKEQVYNDETIRKVLYYGWAGPEQWSGFSSEAQGIVCTSLVLSYYFSGPDSIIILGGPTDQKIGVSAFMNYINSKPNIGNTDISLSKTYTESFLSQDKKYQRTESIKLNADSRNTITIPLPSGVTLVNETTGATGTGNVKIKGGDTFYLKAPLSMNGTWKSGKLHGSMGKFQSVLLVTGSSAIQDLGQGLFATDPENYVEFSVKWVQMGDIRITKFLESDEGLKTPAVGAEFTLTHKETGEKVVITADENGVATTEDRKNYPIGRLIGGVWVVEETKTPEGFKPIDPFEVTISGQGEVFSFIAEDKEIRAALQVVKVDESTGKVITRAGATFKIVDENGKDVEFVDYSPNKVTFTEFTTDENGQFTLPEALPYGDYELVEVKAPEGYLVCEPIPFTVDKFADFETPLVVKAEDKNAMGRIRIQKTDEETKEAVTGAVYQIFAKEDIVTGDETVRVKAGELVGTITTDEQGVAQSEPLYLGSYIVKEFQAPAGFLLDDTEHEVTLTYKDQETEIVTSEMELTNKPTTVVIAKKVAGKEQWLEGVKFHVWNEDMESDLDAGMGMKETKTTNEEGKITLKYLAPGNYCVKELETVPGYVLDDTVYKFTVNEQGAVIGDGQITIENDFTKTDIEKQKLDSGEPLAGAKLQVLDKDGKVVDEWTSTEEAHRIEALPVGDYVLHEVEAPVGYKVAEDIHFSVIETADVQHVIMKDEMKEGTIRTSMPDNFRDGSNTSGGIKTGDNARITLLVTLLGLSAIGMSYILFWVHKTKKKEEEPEHEA